MRQFNSRDSSSPTPVKEAAVSNPFVSIVMPVCNEGEFIEQSLGAVLRQDYRSELLEILIADGMSTDETRTLIADTSTRYPHHSITLLDNPGRRAATGLNTALRAARGEVVVRVDGHTIIAPDYVRQCVAALNVHSADNVGGRMTPEGTSLFARAVALATSSRFGVGGARFHYSEREEWVDTVYLGAWRRELFQRIGLFDEEMVRNQDDEFNYRLLANGGKILLSPKIRSVYYNRTTIKSLWNQYFQYGYWKVRVMQKHPFQMRVRQFVPAIFVLSLLILIVGSFFLPAARLGLICLAGSYCTLNLVATILACLRQSEWRLLPMIAISFGVLHFSYGLGFLLGLVSFWNRWGDATEPINLSEIAGGRTQL